MLRIEGVVAAPRRHPLVEHRHLPATNRCADVAHAVVIADLRMLVVGRRIAGLGRQKPRLLHPIGAVRQQSAAPGGGDDLVAVEAQDADVAETAARLAMHGRSKGLRGVFHHEKAVAAGHFGQRIHTGRHAVEVHRNNHLRPLALRLQIEDRALKGGRTHIPTTGFGVDEDRRSTQISNRIRRTRKGKTLAEHIIAPLHPQNDEGQVDGRRTRTQCRGMRHPRVFL